MTTRNKIMYALAAAVVLAAVILLVVGISTHEEPGLLTACETPTGSLDYTKDCSPVTWDRDQFPLTVYADTSNPYPPANPEEATRSVIDLINNRLGFQALIYSDALDPAITVEIAGASESGTWMTDSNGGASHYRDSGGSLRCMVTTWNTGTLEMLDKVLTHEMYHALGLAHDPYEASAMYPTISSSGYFSRLRVSDHDRDLLRSLYHD